MAHASILCPAEAECPARPECPSLVLGATMHEVRAAKNEIDLYSLPILNNVTLVISWPVVCG